MVRKLQKKFIIIVALVLFAVIGTLVVAVNGINYWQTAQKSEALLKMLVDHDGNFPQNDRKEPPKEENGKKELQPVENPIPALRSFHFSEETPFETRYFSASTTDGGKSWTTDLSHIVSVSESEAEEYAGNAEKKGKTEGRTGVFRYQMKKTQTENEEKILFVFVDCSRDIQNVESVAAISSLAALGCYLLVLLLVTVFSRRALRPLIESMEKQKQFITDAGHELKTPIAIISANTEVLEMCQGESEWTKSIHHQTERLTSLVTQLLTLAKMEEGGETIERKQWNASETVADAVKTFEAPAMTKKIKLQTEIAGEIYLEGDAAKIHQLVSMLLDNAVKYTPESGKIQVKWWKNGKRAELCVENTCDSLPKGDLNRLFDRFYRADTSRARESGGYGIGLSVAAAIVKAHKGKITAERRQDGNGICFRAVFPAR